MDEAVVDLTVLEEAADRRGSQVDRRWVSASVFTIEAVAVVFAILLLDFPRSLAVALIPFVVIALASVRFARRGLLDSVVERSVAIAIRMSIVGMALVPAALLEGAVVNLVATLLIAIAASSVMTVVVYRVAAGSPKRTLIVGSGPVTVDIADHIVEKGSDHLQLIGVLESDLSPMHSHPVLGRPEDLVAIARATAAEVVIVSYGPFAPEDFVPDVRQCVRALDVYVVPRFFELGRDTDKRLDEIAGYPLLRLSPAPTTRFSWRIKRLIDIVASSILLVAFAPVMALIALAVRRSSEGPVLFRQMRVGIDDRPFEILKFRTMLVHDAQHVTWTAENDPRVTPVGTFLRASHLDELPQLWNVLRGDMSLVGPRPERTYFVDHFVKELERYGDRHRVLPGISGWSQVNGLWGDTSVEARVRLDNRYIEDWSLFKDVVIMLATIPTLFKGRD